jgi:hypothetical protein
MGAGFRESGRSLVDDEMEWEREEGVEGRLRLCVQRLRCSDGSDDGILGFEASKDSIAVFAPASSIISVDKACGIFSATNN